MKMKLLLAVTFFTIATASPALWTPGMSSVCMDQCTPPEIASISFFSTACPTGQFCVSNGCGHVCSGTFFIGLRKRAECPLVRCIPCPGGYVIDEDGCQTCQCKEVKRQACSPVMCMMFCFNGFALGPDGCPICRCA